MVENDIIVSFSDDSLGTTWFENATGRGYRSPELTDKGLVIPSGWDGFIYPTDQDGNLISYLYPIESHSYRKSNDFVLRDPLGTGRNMTVMGKDETQTTFENSDGLILIVTRVLAEQGNQLPPAPINITSNIFKIGDELEIQATLGDGTPTIIPPGTGTVTYTPGGDIFQGPGGINYYVESGIFPEPKLPSNPPQSE